MYSQCRNEHSAFTLVELLTLVAIVGILAGLLLAMVVRSKGPARRLQCASNVRQLGLGLQSFVSENHSYPLLIDPPHGDWMMLLQQNELAAAGNSTNHALAAEWEGLNIWRCPAVERPSNWPTNRGYLCYGYNWYGLSARTDVRSLGLGGHFVYTGYRLPIPAVSESEVANPCETIAIGDGFIGGNGALIDGTEVLWRTYGLADYLGSTKRAYARHNGMANVVFCDGHVESPTLDDLFVSTNNAALARWNRDHQPHREKLSP